MVAHVAMKNAKNQQSMDTCIIIQWARRNGAEWDSWPADEGYLDASRSCKLADIVRVNPLEIFNGLVRTVVPLDNGFPHGKELLAAIYARDLRT